MIEKEYLLAGMWVREHRLSVPLNWSDENDPRRITVLHVSYQRAAKRQKIYHVCCSYKAALAGNRRDQPVKADG